MTSCITVNSSGHKNDKAYSPVVSAPKRTSMCTMYVSPSTTTRQNSPAVAPSVGLFTGSVHDDLTEARNRRRSILHERRNETESPNTPNDRNNSNVLNRLTSAQQHEHHSDCIKLSTENKINAKNAFALHLIDYMSLLLKRKQLENFQVASSTLDASAKIYAGRVDAVHTDTYKLMVGLGSRANDADENVDDGAGDDDVNGNENKASKKKKKKAGKSMIANIKNITLPASDIDDYVDPLFHVTSAAFDDGGTSGLLMNHLFCLDHASSLVFDADTVVFDADGNSTSGDPNSRGGGMVDISRLKEMFRPGDFDSKEICPQFSNFTFTATNATCNNPQGDQTDNAHCYDANAVPETLRHDPSDDVYHDDFAIDDDCHDGSFDAAPVSVETSDNASHVVGHSANAARKSACFIRDGTVTDLIPALADELSDYSYFNKRFLKSWAGPSHWSLSSSKSLFHVADEDQKSKTQRKKKAPMRMMFEDGKVFSVFLNVKSRSTVTKATLAKYPSKSKLLPEDLHYEVSNLTNLFLRPHIMLKKRTIPGPSCDGNIEVYDYSNEHDTANFCPDTNDGGNEFDGDADLFNLSDGDRSSTNFGLSQDMSQINTMLQNLSVHDGSVLAGDNLVAEPHKVANIEISYAKTAKRVDVRRLKSAIWDFLSDAEPRGVNTPSGTPGPNKSSDRKMSSCHTFQELLSSLPNKLSRQSANNLSVPIAFVCLLHLANEKVLSIEELDAMSNLNIGQDISNT